MSSSSFAWWSEQTEQWDFTEALDIDFWYGIETGAWEVPSVVSEGNVHWQSVTVTLAGVLATQFGAFHDDTIWGVFRIRGISRRRNLELTMTRICHSR